jgi:hypothetical protein
MKKALCVTAILGMFLALALPAAAQGTPATECPVNYICSLEVTGSAPLIGLGNDGHPVSILGFVNFDDSGKPTATVEVNANGTVHTVTDATGTCTSGTASTPGPITVSTQVGTLTIDFVVARSSASIELLLANHTSESNNDTTVSLGICHASAAG